MWLAFYKASKGTLDDWAIAAFSRGRYSHVELIFSDGMWCGARRANGVQYMYTPHAPTTDYLKFWDYLEVQTNNPVEEVRIRAFCDGEIGCEYDWTGAFAFVIPFLHASESRWFCSEFVVAALQTIGMLDGAVPIKTTPARIYELIRK